jgi:hypothetical protein
MNDTVVELEERTDLRANGSAVRRFTSETELTDHDLLLFSSSLMLKYMERQEDINKQLMDFVQKQQNVNVQLKEYFRIETEEQNKAKPKKATKKKVNNT